MLCINCYKVIKKPCLVCVKIYLVVFIDGEMKYIFLLSLYFYYYFGIEQAIRGSWS